MFNCTKPAVVAVLVTMDLDTNLVNGNKLCRYLVGYMFFWCVKCPSPPHHHLPPQTSLQNPQNPRSLNQTQTHHLSVQTPHPPHQTHHHLHLPKQETQENILINTLIITYNKFKDFFSPQAKTLDSLLLKVSSFGWRTILTRKFEGILSCGINWGKAFLICLNLIFFSPLICQVTQRFVGRIYILEFLPFKRKADEFLSTNIPTRPQTSSITTMDPCKNRESSEHYDQLRVAIWWWW